MRILWVTRSNRPLIASLSQFFLSLATGTLLIAHHKYLTPLLTIDDTVKLQDAMALIVLTSVLKCLLLSALVCCCREKAKSDKIDKTKLVSFVNLIYPGLIKSGTFLSMAILISSQQRLNLAIVSICTLLFIFWLSWCSRDNPLAKTIEKGRTFSPNPIKMGLLYLLVLIASALQPISYQFSFQLHFQIFIIFTTAFLIFCYLYLHKLVLSFGTREKSPRVLCCQSYYQLATLLLLWLYYVLMEPQSLPFLDQLGQLIAHWYVPLLLSFLSVFYQMILWQHIRKLALNQLALTLATGYLWFNIYHMAMHQINARLYVSVMIMLAVLLTNIGLFSTDNCKKINRLCEGQSKKRKRRYLKEEKDPFEEQQ